MEVRDKNTNVASKNSGTEKCFMPPRRCRADQEERFTRRLRNTADFHILDVPTGAGTMERLVASKSRSVYLPHCDRLRSLVATWKVMSAVGREPKLRRPKRSICRSTTRWSSIGSDSMPYSVCTGRVTLRGRSSPRPNGARAVAGFLRSITSLCVPSR